MISTKFMVITTILDKVLGKKLKKNQVKLDKTKEF